MLKASAITARPSLPNGVGALSRPFPPRKTVLTLFGTRPEVIKLAPVIQHLERCENISTLNIASGQHSELLYPFVNLFQLRVHFDLRLMQPGQDSWQLCDRILEALDSILRVHSADLILVQGDTITALAGALAGHQRGIPVGHVEAGLRSGDLCSPYPEEMNRRLITQLATHHFAATSRNRDALLKEGVARSAIFVTGNPVVDALNTVVASGAPEKTADATHFVNGRKTIVLTTHRRESFGSALVENLTILRRFVERHEDVALVFPVHPNPNVSAAAREILGNVPRIALIDPLPYCEFIHLLAKSWLVVSDSGGIQEEAPSLGKPLLILRQNTERPECVEAGIARLAAGGSEILASMLEEAYREDSWANRVRSVRNPFGDGDSGRRIANCISHLFAARPLLSAAI